MFEYFEQNKLFSRYNIWESLHYLPIPVSRWYLAFLRSLMVWVLADSSASTSR